MAIVVVLMGILLTLGIAAFDAQTSYAASSATRRKQEAIKDALVAYLRDYKRLPCPEITAFGGGAPTGSENRQIAGNPASLCASFWGTVPYAELGLSRDMAMDGYDNFFTYFVSNASTASEPDWTLTSSTGVPGFNVGNSGRFAITENGNPTTLSKNLAVVVIVSHGKNGFGAFTIKGTRNAPSVSGSEESINSPSTPAIPNAPAAWLAPSTTAATPPALPNPGIATIVMRDRTDNFDDIVMALRPNDLLTPLIKDGAIKSAEAQLQEQLLAVRDAAIAQLLGSGCVPVANLAGMPSDPWGTPIRYANAATATPLTTSTPPSLTAFQIWSYGQDRADNAGAGDDRTLTTGINVTFGQIRARIPSTACP